MKLLVQKEDLIYQADVDRHFPRSSSPYFFAALVEHTERITLAAPAAPLRRPMEGASLEEIGLTVYPLPYFDGFLDFTVKFPFILPSLIRAAKRLVHEHDAVWLRFPSLSALVFFTFAKWHKKPVFIRIGGDITQTVTREEKNTPLGLLKWLYCYLIHQATKFVAARSIAYVTGHALYRLYAPYSKRCDVLFETLVSERDLFCVEDRCTRGMIEVLFSGQLLESKGLVLLHDVVESLRKDENLDLRLRVMGYGPLEERVRIWSEEQDSFVVFDGKVQDRREVMDRYRKADILAVPSISYPEGFPRVIIEGWASSLPVIVTAIAGIPYTVRHEETGMVVPPGDRDALSQALLSIVRNPVLRKKLIRQGREFVRTIVVEEQVKKILQDLTRELDGTETGDR